MGKKKVKANVKIQMEAGKATPAPPVGTALGPHGVNIMEFVKAYNDRTASMAGQVIPVEITIFEEQVDVAAKHDQLILIHTPHLQDKHKGTRIITDILKNDRRIKRERVLIDHCEEHTIRLARESGFWCGLTIYPVTKVTPQRGADILEMYGTEKICVNSASDWGESSPSMLTDTMLEYRRRGHSDAQLTEVFYNNPCRFFGQSPKWKREPLKV